MIPLKNCRIGLPWFPDRISAYAYFKPVGLTAHDVREKITAEEIHIGTPPNWMLGDDICDRFVLVNEKPGRRWHLITHD